MCVPMIHAQAKDAQEQQTEAARMTNRVSPVVGIQVYCDETRDHRADEVYLLGWPQVRAQRNATTV